MATQEFNTETPFASFSVYEGLLVHIKMNSHTPTYEEFEGFLRKLGSFLEKRVKFTLYINASEMGVVPFAYALKAASFLKENRPMFKQYLLASAVFIKSELVRSLLNAVFMLQPPACPNAIVSSESKGMEFIEQYMTPVSA